MARHIPIGGDNTFSIFDWFSIKPWFSGHFDKVYILPIPQKRTLNRGSTVAGGRNAEVKKTVADYRFYCDSF